MKTILSIFLIAFCMSAQENLKIAYNVFVNEEKDDYEIFTMNLDGSNKKNISNREGLEWVYYAYKDKIYFVSDRGNERRNYNLYEMDANGENVKKISDLRLRDSFFGSRKDGKEFLLFPHKNVDSLALIVNKGGEIIQNIDPGMVYINDGFFSPDGNSLVFRGANKKSKREDGFKDELYVMDLDGGVPIQITHYPENDTTAEWWAYHVGPPIWEPNRNIISYASKQNGNYAIYSVKPDGSNLKKITTGPYDEIYHFWSPDGKYLVYDGTDENKNYDIYILNTETSELTRLTSDEKYEQGPVFVQSN